jgi:hypothetical protein
MNIHGMSNAARICARPTAAAEQPYLFRAVELAEPRCSANTVAASAAEKRDCVLEIIVTSIFINTCVIPHGIHLRFAVIH